MSASLGCIGTYTFTVFTPTYNRSATLGRAYASLCAQTWRDFEWLIVDDGSTDDTRARVAAFQAEANFPIRYLWQQHRHKKAAFNHGVREARGALFVVLDSDDALMPHTLTRLHAVWHSIPEAKRPLFSAVTGLCVRPDGQIVGERYPQDVLDSTSLDIRYRYRVGGEKFGFQRTDVLRQFPFPEDIPGFVPESLVWSAIARQGYLTRFVNETLRIYYDSPDSLSRSSTAQHHALGLRLLARDTLNHHLPWFRYAPLAFLLAAARDTRFGLALRRARPITPLPEPYRRLHSAWARVLVMLMWPLGVVMDWRDRWRMRHPSA